MDLGEFIIDHWKDTILFGGITIIGSYILGYISDCLSRKYEKEHRSEVLNAIRVYQESESNPLF